MEHDEFISKVVFRRKVAMAVTGFPAPPFIDFTACTGFPTIVLATHMMTTL